MRIRDDGITSHNSDKEWQKMTKKFKKLKKKQVLFIKIAKTCDIKELKITPWPAKIFQ